MKQLLKNWPRISGLSHGIEAECASLIGKAKLQQVTGGVEQTGRNPSDP